MAKALGGNVEFVNPQTGNIGAAIYLGKKIVTVNDDFFAQPYVKEVFDPLLSSSKDKEKMLEAIREEMEELIVPSSHLEHVT